MKQAWQGFSLIELMMTLVVMGLLLALAAPSFANWNRNMQVRTAAGAIQNGLQLARGEAVRRNARVTFNLTTNIGNGCALSTVDSNWVVTFDVDDPSGSCGAAFLREAFAVNDATNNPQPRIMQIRSAAEGSPDVVLAAGQSTITFNGLGRVTNAATNPILINVTNPSGGRTCTAAGGDIRCLRVTVTTGGQIRICDPNFPSTGPAANDPQRC